MRHTEERFARVGELDICYDEIGPEDGEPMLMVMGLATQMIGWHEDFCGLLAERGHRVIRFDNRDIGRSTWFDEAGVPGRSQMLMGTGKPAYKLADMAEDARGLLDSLGIAGAHVVGVSQGGMIAQQLAISHPDRVRSLASIMSTPGGRWNAMPRPRAMRALMAPPASERDALIERAVATFRVIGSPGFASDEDYLRSVAGLSFDRGTHPAGIARQLHAVTTSPNRTRALRRLQVPTVVIHGDCDPLVRPVAGRATARAIPGSRLVMIRGMGHDLPRDAWPQIVEAIDENAARAGSDQRRDGAMGATKKTAAITGLVSLALLAGCGGGSAEDTAQDYVDALASGDWAEACSLFSEQELADTFGSAEQCEQTLSEQDVDPAVNDELDRVEVSGSREGENGETIVEFTLDGEEFNELHLVEEDGEWKIQGQ